MDADELEIERKLAYAKKRGIAISWDGSLWQVTRNGVNVAMATTRKSAADLAYSIAMQNQ